MWDGLNLHNQEISENSQWAWIIPLSLWFEKNGTLDFATTLTKYHYHDIVINISSLKVTPVPIADYGISMLCDLGHGRLRSITFNVFFLYYSWSHPGANKGIKLISHRFVWHQLFLVARNEMRHTPLD